MTPAERRALIRGLLEAEIVEGLIDDHGLAVLSRYADRHGLDRRGVCIVIGRMQAELAGATWARIATSLESSPTPLPPPRTVRTVALWRAVCGALAAESPLSVSALARAVDRADPTVWRALPAMERAGLVTVDRSRARRLGNAVDLTAAGRAAWERYGGAVLKNRTPD